MNATKWHIEKKRQGGRWKHHGWRSTIRAAREAIQSLRESGWWGARFRLTSHYAKRAAA